MKNLLWRGIARVVSKPAVADYLIRRAIKTPFSHLPSNDDPSYMARYWLFNAYPESSKNRPRWQFPWSIRLHNIKRPDDDRAMHDHPWNARTIILKGGYTEKRLLVEDAREEVADQLASRADSSLANLYWEGSEIVEYFNRVPGNTATLNHNEYHQITDVQADTWTMFISGPWLGDWGFLVNDQKIWWRKYLGCEPFIDPARKAEDQLISKAMNLGPLAKLVQADGDPVQPTQDFKRNINKAFGKFGSNPSLDDPSHPFYVASNSPFDMGTNIKPRILATDKTAESVGEYDIVGRVEADTLSRVICCTNCEDGCPACDPENLFGWKQA